MSVELEDLSFSAREILRAKIRAEINVRQWAFDRALNIVAEDATVDPFAYAKKLEAFVKNGEG